MSKDSNLSKEQLDMLLAKLKTATNGKIDLPKDVGTKDELEDFVMKRLNSKQTDMLSKLLKDQKAAEELLATPQAQQLLKNLVKEKDDG